MINEDDQRNGQKDEWDEMSSLWQKQDVSVPKDLPKTIRRKTIQMYLIFGSEAVVGLFGVLVGLWLLFYRDDDFSRIFGYFAIVASVLSVAISWWIRRGIWQGQSSSPIDQVELSIKRAKASINYANFNLISVVIMLVLLGVFYLCAPDMFGDKYEEKGSKLLLASGVMVASMLAVSVGSVIYKAKKQRELRSFTNLLNQLKDE